MKMSMSFKNAQKNHRIIFRKRSSLCYMVYKRVLFTTKQAPNNGSENAVIEPSKSQNQNAISNTFGYYGANLANLSSRFYKEFEKYYKNLSAVAKNGTFSKLSNHQTQIKNENDLNIKLEKKPIILKEVTAEENLMKPLNQIQPLQQQQQQKQQEKQIATRSLDEKILQVCNSLEKASSLLIKSRLIADLFNLLYNEREASFLVYKKHKNILIHLLNLKQIAEDKRDKSLVGNINQVLSVLGHVENTKHRSINILSIDGGGAKGFVAIEILKNIEKHCRKPISEIFDYICGVSTGAVLAALLGVYKLSLDECERQYKIFVKEIFQRNRAAGISSLIGSYGYYDTKIWESMLHLLFFLRDAMGETLVVNSAKEKNACKLSIVSNLTTPKEMKIFLFRNYNLPCWAQSQYDGTIRYKVWEAVRASSAAPGYYEDFKLDGYVFHDGGVLANNPTCIALHEAKQLWPSYKDNYVIVSIGNGRYKPTEFHATRSSSISLKQKINRIVSGVSDPEIIHRMLIDLMPAEKYFRFNPFMTEEFNLDENRPIKWQLMQYETNMYMRRNEAKFAMAAKQLLKPKTALQIAEELLYNKNYI